MKLPPLRVPIFEMLKEQKTPKKNNLGWREPGRVGVGLKNEKSEG